MQAIFTTALRQDGEGIRTSSETSASEVADEERETDTDRCDESGTMFLGGEHEDGKDQERSQEHFDEEAADARRFR